MYYSNYFGTSQKVGLKSQYSSIYIYFSIYIYIYIYIYIERERERERNDIHLFESLNLKYEMLEGNQNLPGPRFESCFKALSLPFPAPMLPYFMGVVAIDFCRLALAPKSTSYNASGPCVQWNVLLHL